MKRFQNIQITTAFLTGVGRSFTELAPNHLAFEIPADPASVEPAAGYDYYFCVRVENPSSQTQTLTLDARRAGYSTRQVDWQPSRVPVLISTDLQSWYVLDEVLASPNHEEYRCRVELQPAQAVYLANSIPYPANWMAARLQTLQTEKPDFVTIHTIGKSIQGRELQLLTISEPGEQPKDRILVTSGFHPAEPDWLATTAILEALLADDEWARAIRQNFSVDVVVQVNPDGFDLGYNACNANGINLYWDFRPDEADTSPEARHLWNWIAAHPPVLYLDFHAYVHQLHKDYRPYLRPLSDYAPALRPMVRRIDRALVKLCGGRFVQGANTSLASTLAAQMTAAFGTVTYPKFHVHFNHGVAACQQLGLDVFKIAVDTAREYQPLTPITRPKDPNLSGLPEKGLFWWEQSVTGDRIRRKWRELLALLGRPEMAHSALYRPTEPGLRPHWRQHLWSQRAECDPVIAVAGGDV